MSRATSGEVVITGLDGALPSHLRAGRIELRDPGGVWLQADHVLLDWNALPALWDHIAIQSLSAERIALLRRPQARETASGSAPRIDIDALSLPDIVLGPTLVGHSASLAAHGSLHYVSRHDLRVNMAVVRAQSADKYLAQGGIVSDVANGRLTAREGADGLLGRLIGLPGLSPVNLDATASGGGVANALSLTLTAGKLSAQGRGMLSLADRRADIAFDANAPATRLNATLGWTSLAAKGRFIGGFDTPDVQADVRIVDFDAGGYRAAALVADITGGGGRVNATARLEGLRTPGGAPDLLARTPALVNLTVDLSAPRQPLRFSLHHTLAGLEGTAHLRGTRDVQARLTVPSLTPFGPLLGGDIAGAASAAVEAAFESGKSTVTLRGEIKASGGAMAARLLGHATVNAHAVLSGGDIETSQLTLDGAGLASRVAGELRGGRSNFNGSLTLKDLSRLTSALSGQAALSGRVTGPAAKALVMVSGSADVAGPGLAREHWDISLRATGLPKAESATFKARGRLNKAPATLDATLSGKGSGRAVKIAGDWKSLALRATVALPAQGVMTGHGTLDLKTLNDMSSFTGLSAKGALHLAAQLTAPGGKTALLLNGRANDIDLAGLVLGLATIDGEIADPFARPTLSLTMQTSQFSAQGWTGEGRGKIRGPLGALALQASFRLADPHGAPADLSADFMLDFPGRTLALRQMRANWRGESLTAAAPGRIKFADGLSVDGLKLAVAGGTVTLSGRITPKLDIAISAQSIRAEAVSLFLPQFSASGTLSGTAALNGTLASPQGILTLRGLDLRNRVYAVTAAAVADLDARAVLHGKAATVNATLTAGKSARLTLNGEAPLDAGGALDLHLAGSADLVLLDPLLAAGGQRIRGTVQIDTAIAGTRLAPKPRGSIILTGGEYQDFARGVHLRDIEAKLQAQKGGIHIMALSARAGSGTVSGSGTLDAWSPGMPLDITLRADNARPIVSDLLTAVLSGSARLTGKLQEDMVLKGAITVGRAEVTLPQSFPPQVRTLNVRHRGEPPLLPPKHGTSVTLDLAVRSAGPLTLRGRGIDADLGGNLDISGLAQAPRIGGGFDMRRGTLTLAGQVLNFTTGKITFDGTGVRGRMDPALDFVASETSGGVTATLTVGGYASLPKVSLSSSPQLPQDEVLARLLFQQSAKQLGPLQLAEGAQALASIAGIGSGFSPMASLRGGLGLDRLSVGSGSGPTSGTTIEAGKHVFRNVYVGARQGVSGGTQAQVQVDLTKNLKAQATVSTGANAAATRGATAAEDNGSNIGLSYQFDY
ncbi:MAG: translocation/assembly module TamB domain-containing protein [Alphaproteobacteria bacterium]|nr:translocation/assembly module TamB domain-containing protein [Alphaproteobacteria bacterium]